MISTSTALRLLAAIAFLTIHPAGAQTPPATFSRTITTGTQSATVNFAYHPIRSSNFRVLVQQADGSYVTFTPDVARTYLGTVTGYPGAIACGLLRADGTLLAKIGFEDGKTWITTGGTGGTASAGGSDFVPAWPTTVIASGGGAGSVVYAAEVGIDSTYNHFTACGGSAAAVVEQGELSVMSADMVYLRDAAILHRIGCIVVRADTTQDPYTADGGDTSLLLPQVRTLWNTGSPMGSTHDAALVAHAAANGGLAYVGTVGTSSRYAAVDSDAGGDFSLVWRHEVGHNWSSNHYEGGGTPEGATIMSGNGLSRFSSSELLKIITYRNSKTSVLDNLGSYAFPLPPRANQDTAMFLRNTPVRIDPLANDSDSNGDSISLLSFDSVSSFGGTLTRSVGTGSGGRDEIIYTPPATLAAGTDWFKYRIQDATGLQAVGYVMLRPQSELVQPADRWQLDDAAGTTAVNTIRTTQNGTHANGVLVNQDGASTTVTRRSAYYDGIDDQTSIPAPGYNTNTLTVTAWIKRNGNQNASAPVIFSRAGTTVTGLQFGSANELRYTWDGGGSTWAPSPALTVPDNQWCFVAMCVSPTATTLYLRTPGGLQSATNTATQAAEAFDGLMYLGYDSYSSSRHFKGWLDDVRAYKNTLKSADIESLYQEALNPPAVALTAPAAGAAISPLNVAFAATVSTRTELMDRVDMVENGTVLATAATVPYQAVLAALAPGSHTVAARAAFGDWGYAVDSAPVTFTALPAPLPVVQVAVSLPASKRGPIAGSFTFTRDHPLAAITVPFTLGGTAIAGTDYNAISNSVTFPDGSLTQTITVNPIAATPDTLSETLALTLNSGSSYALGTPASATLTIDDHITSIASSAWNVATTWNSGAAAPTTGTQNTGEGYAVAHTVTSNDTSSNSQALVARYLRVMNGGILDLARLHSTTNQNVSYNLPSTSIDDGGTIRFRCSVGSSTHTVTAALAVAGATTLRLNGGSYDDSANLTGPLTGSGTIAVVSDTSAGSDVRKISVNSSNNPFAGNWSVNHTAGGSSFGALRAGAAKALGTGTVTVGTRAQLINDNTTGLDSLSGVIMTGATSSLMLNQPWTNSAASLALTGGTPVVQLGNAASAIGNLSGTTGVIQGSGSSSALTVNQTAEAVFGGTLGTNLRFTKAGTAALTLTGAPDPSLALTLANGPLTLPVPATIASLTQSGGTLRLALPANPSAAPLTLSGAFVRTGGTIALAVTTAPLTDTPYLLIGYQGNLTGIPQVTVTDTSGSGLLAVVSPGTGSASAVTVMFSVPPPPQFTLSYAAGAHGSLTGQTVQAVIQGNDGTTVTAVPDTGYSFSQWSDGVTSAARTDTAVTADLSVTAAFTINENPYDLWIQSFPNITDPAAKTPTADADHDGLANAIEFVLGSDPSLGNAGSPITAAPTAGNYIVSFTRVKAAAAAGFTSAIEYSSSLAASAWTTATPAMTRITDHGDTESVTVTIPISSGNARLFVRLKVTAP